MDLARRAQSAVADVPRDLSRGGIPAPAGTPNAVTPSKASTQHRTKSSAGGGLSAKQAGGRSTSTNSSVCSASS